MPPPTLLSTKILGSAFGAAVPGPAQKVEPGVPLWIHLATEGFYKGHPSAPEGIQFDRAFFEQVIANFRSNPSFRLGPDGVGCADVIPTDYEHVSEMNPSSGTIPQKGAPSPAWVKDLKIADGDDGRCQFWAFTEITSNDLLNQLNGKEYRWTSVAITRRGIHPVSGQEIGPVLTSFAFTNHPFLQGLTPIVASTNAELIALACQTLRELGYTGTTESKPNRGQEMPADFMSRLSKSLKCRDTEDSILLAAEAAVETADKAEAGTDAMAELMALFGAESTQGLLKKCMSTIDMASKVAPLVQALSQINEQMSGAQTAEAETECSAVVASSGFTDKTMVEKFKKIVMSERLACLDETEIAGVKFRSVNSVKLAAFRKEYPVAAPMSAAQVALTQNVFAGAGGSQIAFSAGPGGTLIPGQAPATNAEDPMKIELSNQPGRNQLERVISYLSTKEPAFKSLPWADQVARASKFEQTGK